MTEETKKEENEIHDNNTKPSISASIDEKVIDNNRSAFSAGIRGFAYGAGIAGAFLVAINAQFGPQIKAYFDTSKQLEYYAATLEQRNNEQKRSNQLIEQLQRHLSEIQQDQGFARKVAIEQRDELAKKLDQVLVENQTEKAERLKIKQALELSNSNINQGLIDLKKCREECLKGKK